MKKVKYVLKSEKFNLEGRDYYGFGIDARDNSEKILASVSDVSCCRSETEALVTLCNSTELSEVHLIDVIEDHINE